MTRQTIEIKVNLEPLEQWFVFVAKWILVVYACGREKEKQREIFGRHNFWSDSNFPADFGRKFASARSQICVCVCCEWFGLGPKAASNYKQCYVCVLSSALAGLAESLAKLWRCCCNLRGVVVAALLLLLLIGDSSIRQHIYLHENPSLISSSFLLILL